MTISPALVAAGCASTTGPVVLQQPVTPAATAFSDVRLPLRAECIVQLTNGAIVRGRLAGIAARHVELDVDGGRGGHARVIAHDDVEVLAQMKTMSRGKRAKIGAAVAALVSLPFGISAFGDMVMPAAIAGALLGYNTGEAHAEVVFQRRPARNAASDGPQ